jgi:hypothetical protein
MMGSVAEVAARGWDAAEAAVLWFEGATLATPLGALPVFAVRTTLFPVLLPACRA